MQITVITMRRALLLAVLITGCTDDHYGSPTVVPYGFDGGHPATVWLDAFPNPIDVSWHEASYDCIGESDTVCSGGQPHAFQIKSVTCAGCDVLVDTATGFRAFDASDVKVPAANDRNLFAKPTVVGDVRLTIELETADGVNETSTLQVTGDHIASVSALCYVEDQYQTFLGGCASLAMRPADSAIAVIPTLVTSRGESHVLGEVAPFTPEFDAFLPRLAPDDVESVGGHFFIPATTAASETLTWDGITAPITILIPPVE